MVVAMCLVSASDKPVQRDNPLAIWMVSRAPFVVNMPTFAPLRVAMALVPMVVP